ncbi:hypothetical protein DL93DRAFT_2070891 [Clavulina sp. PMI_390]|nr:hypothetical protein DL93DRAFT_2070891 [Clavulina sp. PMI_390]
MGFWNEAKRGWNLGVHSQRGIDALKEEQWTTAAYEFTEALKYCDPNEERIDVWKRRYLAYFNPPGVDRDLMRKARADIISIRNAKESALTDHMRYAEAFCAYALDLYDEAIPLALLAIDQNSTTQFNSQLRDLIQKSLDERDGTGAAIQRAQTAMGEGLWEFAASEYTNALQNCTSDRDRIRVWKQRYRAYWNPPGADRELMRKARADILAVRGADASELTDHMRYAQAFCAYMLDMYDEAISSARYALTNNSTTEYDSQLGDVIKKSQDERGSANIVKRQNEALSKGVDAMDKERWDEAVNHFTEALDLERNDEDKAKILQLRVKANWTPAGAQKLDLFRRVHTDLQWIRRLTGKPLDEHQSYMSAFSLYFIDEYDDAIGEIRAALPRTTDSELQQRLLDILDKCHKEKESKKARDTMKLGIAAHNSEEYEKAAGLYTRALSQTKDLKLRMEIIHFRMMSYWVVCHSPFIDYRQILTLIPAGQSAKA